MSATLYMNRYELGPLLGKGGMGAVYRARDHLSNTTVALKSVLHKPDQLLFSSRSNFNNTQTALAHEFQLLASLRHPNIISVLDYGFGQDRLPFFTMTLLDNAQPITQAAHGRSTEYRIRLLIQLLQALHYLHRRGILHRDLKPSNVLVTHDGHVRVLDFGLAMDSAVADGVVGTIAYIAPEVLSGGATTPAADLYAVGVIAFEIFTGTSPYSSRDSMQMLVSIMQGSPDFSMIDIALAGGADAVGDGVPFDDTTKLLPNAINKTVPGDTNKNRMPKPDPNHRPLTAIIQQLMQKDPASRYPNSQAVIRDLAALLEKPVVLETDDVRESFLQGATFVGRQAELHTLNKWLLEAEKGLGSAWLVGGESGVGKSRLMNELRVQALVHGVQVLRGQGVSDGGLPYQYWREPVREVLLLVSVTDGEAVVLSGLVPDIETILRRPIPQRDSPVTDWDVADTIVAVFRRLTYPVLLLMEDLHWATESLDVLARLSATVDVLPLMIVGSYRTEERPNLPETLPNHRLLQLTRLERTDIEALSRAMLGTSGTAKRIVDFIEQQTAGNCFFMVEVLRALAEEAGYLEGVPTMVIPPDFEVGGVQAILQRRLDRVPAWAQPLLELAAMIGRGIDLHLMTYLKGQLHSGVDVDRWLLVVMEALVVEVRDNRWQFSHDKLREAILATVAGARQRDLHTDVAEAIEAVYPDDPNRAAILYVHWSAAGDLVKLRHYAMVAGDKALQRGQFDDAMNYFNAILHNHPMPQEEATAFLNLAYLHLQQGSLDDAHALLAQVIGLARAGGWPHVEGEASQVLAEVKRRQGALDEALTYAMQSKDLLAALGNMGGVAKALITLGDVYRIRGEFEAAIGHLDEALVVVRDRHDRKYEAAIMHTLAVLHYYQNNLARAQQLGHEALVIMRELGIRREEYRILNALGGFAWVQGNLPLAAQYYEESLEIVEAVGDKMKAMVEQNLASVYADLGDFDRASDFYDRALAGYEQTHDPTAMIGCLLNLSEMYIDRQIAGRAASLTVRALALAQQLESPSLECSARLNLAIFHLHQREIDNAIAHLRVAITLDAEDVHHEADLMLGIALLIAGLADEARTYLQQAIDHAQAIVDDEPDLFAVWYAMGLAHAALAVIEGEPIAAALGAYQRGIEIAPHAGIILHQTRLLDILGQRYQGDLNRIYALLNT